jgi:ribonuclease D
MIIPPAQYIQSADALHDVVEGLQQSTLLAVDTESNNLHAYTEQVCLIQLSSREADYIVDPLAFDDLSALNTLFAEPKIEKVLHAAEYDISCLKRDFNFEFQNVFDTMIAARLVGLDEVGLGAILWHYVGVEVDKSHQLDNWGLRPLPEESLRYAQMDTHFLPYLRDEFLRLLRDMGHLAEFNEICKEFAETSPASRREYDPAGFWRLGRPNRLTRRSLRVLKAVCDLGDELARELDLPPYRLFSNKALLELARRKPANYSDLKACYHVSNDVTHVFGDRILDAVEAGQAERRLPPPPPNRRPAPEVSGRYAALHSWRKARAQQRGIESDVIVSKQTLWDLARRAPQHVDDLHDVPGIGPWRQAAYGEEIIHVLEQFVAEG